MSDTTSEASPEVHCSDCQRSKVADSGQACERVVTWSRDEGITKFTLISGQTTRSHSIKNPQVMADIMTMASKLTSYERGLLANLIRDCGV